MNGAVIAIALIAGIIGFITLVTFEEEGCFPICVIGAIAVFLIYHNWTSPEMQVKIDEATAIVDKNCPNEYEIVDSIPKCKPKEKPVEVDVSVPDEETPKEESKEESKEEPKEEPKEEFDFQKWAQGAVDGANQVCDKDGNAVNVSGWVYTDGPNKGTPASFTAWTRFGPDGKPIRCNNGKAPKEAEPKKDVLY